MSAQVRELAESAPEPAPFREPTEPAPVREHTESAPEPAPVREPSESALVREPTESAPVREPTVKLPALPAPPWPPALPARPGLLLCLCFWAPFCCMDLARHPSPLSTSSSPPSWTLVLCSGLWSVWNPLLGGGVLSQLPACVPKMATRDHCVCVEHMACCVCVVPCAFFCLLSVLSHLVTETLFQWLHLCLPRYPCLSPYLAS